MSNLVLRQSKGDASQIAVPAHQVRVGFSRRQARLRPLPFDLNSLTVGRCQAMKRSEANDNMHELRYK